MHHSNDTEMAQAEVEGETGNPAAMMEQSDFLYE